MKWIIYIFSSLWRLWFLTVFILTFLIFLPLLFLYSTIYKNPKIICYIARYWSQITLLLSFIIIKKNWEEKLNNKEVFIFCPNHTSTLDIPFIFAVLPFPIQFMGKAELTKIPLFGYFFKQNSVIVNRKNIKNSYDAFKSSADRIDQGLSMCIFPEGGIPKKDIILKRFKNGAFKLAQKKQIRIVPVTMPDNKKIFPKEYFKGYPSVARITIHKPIEFTDISIDYMNKSVYSIIFEKLKSYENNK